jgi:hypothetical protein
MADSSETVGSILSPQILLLQQLAVGASKKVPDAAMSGTLHA